MPSSPVLLHILLHYFWQHFNGNVFTIVYLSKNCHSITTIDYAPTISKTTHKLNFYIIDSSYNCYNIAWRKDVKSIVSIESLKIRDRASCSYMYVTTLG